MDTDKKHALKRARYLYFHGKAKESLDIYLPYAESGHEDSQVFVGWLYSKGCKNVEQDLKQAKRWLEPAAESGNVDAIYLLGIVYSMAGNHHQAISKLNSAAELGYSAAYYQLGKIYFTGIHTERNNRLAYDYFNSASKLGHIFAKREVALMNIKGYKGISGIPIGLFLFVASIFTGIYSAIKDPYGDITYE